MSSIIFNDFTDSIITLNVNGVQLNDCFGDESINEIITNSSDLNHETEQIFAQNGADMENHQHQQEDNSIISNIQKDILNEKLQNVCRCCLIQNCEMKSIFDENDCIATMIVLLTNLEISPDDGFPKNICLDCLTQLTKCINFKQQIDTADMTLRHYITEGFQKGMILEKIDVEQLAKGIEEINENDLHELENSPIPTTENNLKNDCNHFLSSNISNSDEMFCTASMTSIAESQESLKQDQISISNEKLNTIIEDNDNEILFEQTMIVDDDNDEKNYDNFTDDDNEEKIFNEQNDRNDEEKKKINYLKKEKINNYIDDNTSSDNLNENESQNGNNLDSNEEKQNSQETIKHNQIEEKLICDKCNKSFKDRHIYTRHVESHSKLYFCEYCKQSFRYRTVFQNHRKCHDKEKSNEKIDDNDNKNNKKTENSLECKICKAKFSLKDDLYVHGSLHDYSDKFICRKCGKEFPVYIKLKRHVPTHFENKPYKCEVCDMGFSELASLTRHFRKHTDEKKVKKFKCKFCDKKYYDSHSLRIHIRTHTGEKPCECEICNKRFVDVRLLNSHMKIHANEKMYECEICKKRFTHASTLSTHIRLHTGVKPYVCGVCNKTFIQTSNLNLHMRVHTREKPYKCDICDMSFSSSSSLSTHRHTHNNHLNKKGSSSSGKSSSSSLLSCIICNKLYSPRHLKIHMRIHLDEKPYECDDCPKKFRTSGQLNQHKKIHLRKQQQQQQQQQQEQNESRNENENVTKRDKKRRIRKQNEQKSDQMETKKCNSTLATSVSPITATTSATTTTATTLSSNLSNPNKNNSNMNLRNNNHHQHQDHHNDKNDDFDSDALYHESEILVDNLLASVSDNVNCINPTSCYFNNNGTTFSTNDNCNDINLNEQRHIVTISELTDELNNS